MIGGGTGTLRRQQVLVLGRYDEDGRLRGRLLHAAAPDAVRRLADHLTEARPAPAIRGPAYGPPLPEAAASPCRCGGASAR
ncbi:hypothetical protein GCM10010446_24000 [Streptomyces enissocaesilis]|uniref:Uncharacterized protein n=1 Tax=Streptomyces enissocaesilis TaxID=332589 RepID=A0ABN3X5A5_9ACTN